MPLVHLVLACICVLLLTPSAIYCVLVGDVVFVLLQNLLPPHRNARGKRKMSDSSSTQQSQTPRVQRELSPAFGNIQFCNMHNLSVAELNVSRNLLLQRRYLISNDTMSAVWLYQNPLSVRHVSKKHVLVGSYFYPHISYLLSFDINNMVSFDTKYFFPSSTCWTKGNGTLSLLIRCVPLKILCMNSTAIFIAKTISWGHT